MTKVLETQCTLPTLAIQSGWSDRALTEAVAQRFIRDYRTYYYAQDKLLDGAYDIAWKKGAKKAYKYYVSEFEKLFSFAMMQPGHDAEKKKRQVRNYFLIVPTECDSHLEIGVMCLEERKLHYVPLYRSGIFIDKHFIASAIRRLRIEDISELSNFLLQFLFIFLQRKFDEKYERGRHIVLKKGLGYLVFNFDRRDDFEFHLVTIITENLYHPGQRNIVDKLFEKHSSEEIILLPYASINHDVDIDDESILGDAAYASMRKSNITHDEHQCNG